MGNRRTNTPRRRRLTVGIVALAITAISLGEIALAPSQRPGDAQEKPTVVLVHG